MRRWWWASVLVWVVACGDDGGGSSGGGQGGSGGGSAQGAAGAGAGSSTGGSTSDGGASSGGAGGSAVPAPCPDPLPSGWLFCDDFEDPDIASRYFEYADDEGDFVRTDDEAASGSWSMQVLWQAGEVGAGNLKVTFGNNPIGSDIATSSDFETIYWRMRVKHQPGWTGSPAKLSRATAFSAGDWSQAMIAHLWSSGEVLLGDPASCVQGSTATCQGYNDFSELQWLGQMPGSTPIFSTEDAGTWRCIEGHVTLNTPGQNDGVFEFWIDGTLEASRQDLNWRGSWTDYGINAVFFENWWNDGSPTEQQRWFDDLVIATEPIGCD